MYKICYWHQVKSFHMLPSAYCVLNIPRRQMSPLTLTLIRYYITYILYICVCVQHIICACLTIAMIIICNREGLPWSQYYANFRVTNIVTLGLGPGIWNTLWPECQGCGVLYPSLIPCILKQAIAPILSASVSSSIKWESVLTGLLVIAKITGLTEW